MIVEQNENDNFRQETYIQWQRTGGRFYKDNPSFAEIWNYIIENSKPQHVNQHPIAQLVQYLQSLSDICHQSLYALERVSLFCDKENSNVFSFYVSHYIYDFFARVKTATDVLALMIKHIYEFPDTQLRSEDCALERGRVTRALRDDSSTDEIKEELARTLDKTRTWVKPFYDLRNVIIHRHRLYFPALGATNAEWRHGIYIAIPHPDFPITLDRLDPLGSLEPLADQGEPFSIFLRQIRSKAIHSSYGLYVEPVTLCEEIWILLSNSIEEIIKKCKPQIYLFMSKNE
jgi:hypothetical protein